MRMACLTGLIVSAIILASQSFADSLPIPENLSALSSPQGQDFFYEAKPGTSFWKLMDQFETQQTQSFCGIASSVMVLNALGVEGPKDPVFLPYRPFSQDNFFSSDVNSVLPKALVLKQGATLDQIGQALAKFSVHAKAFHADEVGQVALRKTLVNYMHAPSTYIIIDFFRPALHQEGAGHFSPLAAYDAKSDRFLMLDVARFRYPPVWIKTQDLWNAINTEDTSAHKLRGFVVVQK